MIRTRQRALLQAYQRGVAAFKLGLPMEGCPYPLTGEWRQAWERGFADERRRRARHERKIKVELENATGSSLTSR